MLRQERKQRFEQKLDGLLYGSKGWKELAKIIATLVKRKMIKTIIDKTGKEQSTQSEIVKVFAAFYQDLFSGSVNGFAVPPWDPAGIEQILAGEVEAAIKSMKTGRACASDGLLAEMLKSKHQGLISKIALVFTEVLRGSLDILQKR